jgi:tRNA(Ile)-lysidine synthase
MPSPDLYASHSEKIKSLIAQGSRVCVGLSGGLDSVVLLDLLHRLQLIDYIELFSIHVNHQLSPHASQWADFCRQLCAQKNIPLQIETVTVARDSGLGIEAAARETRYAVFKKQHADVIALAHHADDQAETLLLQLLRGAGVKGASAMPMLSHSTPVVVRPLLGVTRAELEIYAAQRELKWITDESNADIRFDRNYVRHEVMPRIEQRFPAYRATLGRSAQHFAEAAQLLDELAGIDAKNATQNNSLSQTVFAQLSQARSKNLLRYFLAQHLVAMPQAARLDELVRQLQTCERDAEVCAELGEHEVRAWRGHIYVIERSSAVGNLQLSWNGEEEIKLPSNLGALKFTPTKGPGISVAKLINNAVTIRTRSGGETLQLIANRPRRTLKNLLQESDVPPWKRERLPLLFCGEAVVWVPDIGMDINFQAVGDEPAYDVEWVR